MAMTMHDPYGVFAANHHQCVPLCRPPTHVICIHPRPGRDVGDVLDEIRGVGAEEGFQPGEPVEAARPGGCETHPYIRRNHERHFVVPVMPLESVVD